MYLFRTLRTYCKKNQVENLKNLLIKENVPVDIAFRFVRFCKDKECAKQIVKTIAKFATVGKFNDDNMEKNNFIERIFETYDSELIGLFDRYFDEGLPVRDILFNAVHDNKTYEIINILNEYINLVNYSFDLSMVIINVRNEQLVKAYIIYYLAHINNQDAYMLELSKLLKEN